MRAQEFVSEKWSAKYKRSINCANPKGFSQRAHCAGRRKNEDLNEFAPVNGDDREPNEEEILRHLAAQWWLGTEQEMTKAQRTLAAMGWDIGQDESGDEDAGVFVIRAGDENGDSYIAFNHSDLSQLNELSFKGSPCTKDCSGHRAGYEWSQRKGGVDAASWSRSFNNGAALFKNGF